MSETLSSSLASSLSSTLPPKASIAVLVKGPECREDAGVLAVEPARCQSVDLNSETTSPSPKQRNNIPLQVPVLLQAMFWGTANDEEKDDEEHELVEGQSFFEGTTQQQDISREYGYKYEFSEEVDGNCCQSSGAAEEDDDDDDELEDDQMESLLDQAAYTPLMSSSSDYYFNGASSITTTTRSLVVNTQAASGGPCILILGKAYDPIHEYEAKRNDELSLFWFTYRCDFPEIVPYRITTDAGWGCMLRSAQMLLAQALRMHFKSRHWTSHTLSLAQRRRETFLRSLLTWMADFPSSADNVYSLHNMVAAGMSKYEILPGEWYGPGTACYVLRDLVHAHETRQVAIWKRKRQLLLQQQQQQQQETTEDGASKPLHALPDKPVRVFRVYVASQGTVYKDAVQELMTKESRAEYEREKARNAAGPKQVPDHPLATAEEDLKEQEREKQALQQLEWDTGLLLLIPLRLGLQEINEDYAKSLAFTFSIPQSVGVLGGRPRGARWFYGAYADGSKIMGLDPHTVQNAPRKRTARVNGKAISVVDISADYLRSIHTTQQETVPLLRMDPSIALGFYCKSQQELQHIQKMIQQGFKALKLPEIFTIQESSPDYANGSKMMTSSMLDDLMSGGDIAEEQDGDGDVSDEDEYVML